MHYKSNVNYNINKYIQLIKQSANGRPLYPMKCKDCNTSMTRFKFNVHDCSKDKLKCDKCEMQIMRKNMSHHITVCNQKWLDQKGIMINEHREIVAKALKYCQQQQKFKASDIRQRLMDQGMYSMVIPGDNV